jgi:hypothetical protein
MEATCFSETSVYNIPTWRHTPEDGLHLPRFFSLHVEMLQTSQHCLFGFLSWPNAQAPNGLQFGVTRWITQPVLQRIRAHRNKKTRLSLLTALKRRFVNLQKGKQTVMTKVA